MTPGAHLLASWLAALPCASSHRERRIVALAGVSPDLDGLGWLVDHLGARFGYGTDYYFSYHHAVAHNLLAALIISAIAAAAAKTRRLVIFGAALLVIHLHFLCDVAGSRGPDGYQWPIPYLLPFSAAYDWTWSGQWELNAWQNVAITFAMLALACWIGWRRRYSFVETISVRLDRAFFAIVARYAGG